jgi:hypothetical protein
MRVASPIRGLFLGFTVPIVVWAVILFPALLLYFIVADANTGVGQAGLRIFQVSFYTILAVAPLLALGATSLAMARFKVPAKWVAPASLVALLCMGFLLVPVLQIASAWNECVFGTPFPFEVEGCD